MPLMDNPGRRSNLTFWEIMFTNYDTMPLDVFIAIRTKAGKLNVIRFPALMIM